MFTWNLWFNVVTIDFASDNSVTWHVEKPEWLHWMDTGKIVVILAIVCDVWSFVCSMYTVTSIIKLKFFKHTAESIMSSKRVQMVVFSVYLFLIRLSAGIMSVVLDYNRTNYTYVIIMLCLVDVVQFSVPWIFLVTQKHVRTAVRNTLFKFSNATD
uniref:Serpentine receptor class gamma n=1 Tax=Panagrellus redivivus TaxID=6233 RepID=A0A7E4VRT9_PANRE